MSSTSDTGTAGTGTAGTGTADSTVPAPTAWPCLAYRDARAGIAFLVEALGFEERLVVPGEGDDQRQVAHAELVWPPGGGVMVGSVVEGGGPFADRPAGAACTYLVTDEPDALLERAVAAGAEVVAGLEDTDYGSRGFTVRDPEGNLWSTGTYRGEPRR